MPWSNYIVFITHTHTLLILEGQFWQEFICLKVSFHNTSSSLEGMQPSNNAAPLLPAQRGQLSPPAWAPMQQAAKQGTTLCQHSENLAVKLTSKGDSKDSSVDSHPLDTSFGAARKHLLSLWCVLPDAKNWATSHLPLHRNLPILIRLWLFKGLMQGRSSRTEGWKVLSIPTTVHTSFDNPVFPNGRGECICLDIVHEEPKEKKCQLSIISSDTEYALKDGHRMAFTTSDLNEQFRKVHKCSLKIGEKKVNAEQRTGGKKFLLRVCSLEVGLRLVQVL